MFYRPFELDSDPRKADKEPIACLLLQRLRPYKILGWNQSGMVVSCRLRAHPAPCIASPLAQFRPSGAYACPESASRLQWHADLPNSICAVLMSSVERDNFAIRDCVRHTSKFCRSDMNCWSWVVIVCTYLKYERGETSNRVDDSTASSLKVLFNQSAHTIMEIPKRLRVIAEIIFVKNRTSLLSVVSLNLVSPDMYDPWWFHHQWQRPHQCISLGRTTKMEFRARLQVSISLSEVDMTFKNHITCRGWE